MSAIDPLQPWLGKPFSLMGDAQQNIRLATEADASELGQVHVECWRETYTGLLPNRIVDALNAPDRANLWRRVIRGELLPGSKTFVVEERRSLLGFASCCPQREPQLAAAGYDGEVSAIYLLRKAQGRHLGSALLHAVALALEGMGKRGVGVWVLRQNGPARAFYERLGADQIAEREEDRHEATLGEVAYGWWSVQRLAEAASAFRHGPNDRS